VRKGRGYLGVRMLLVAALLVVFGLLAGAAVPGTASADGDNGDNGDNGELNSCTGTITQDPDPDDEVTVQTCTVTAPTGTCIQRSDDPIVIQTCTFTQSSSMSNLRATATQIHNPEEGFPGFVPGEESQDGTQTIDVTQNNTSTNRSNFVLASQITDQCLGSGDAHEDEDGDWNDDDGDGDRDSDGACEDEDEDDGDDEEKNEDESELPVELVGQSQDVHQSIDVDQTNTGAGKNDSNAFQAELLHERASNATTINQRQNTDDELNTVCDPALITPGDDPNGCYTVDQTANTGSNISRLLQVSNLFQSARHTDGGVQEQGAFDPFEGGFSHGFDQVNTGTAPNGTPIQVSQQAERMTQRRDDVGFFTWYQHGPLRKDVGNQVGDDTARANMSQDSRLSSTEDLTAGEQTSVLDLQCSSSGTCTGRQHAETNDDEADNFDSDGFIHITIVCGDPEPPDELTVFFEVPPECVAENPGEG
jgi:hypothetical protein